MARGGAAAAGWGGGQPSTSSTPVARFSGTQALFVPQHPEMGSKSRGEIPVNSHLKVTWLLYSQII